LAVLRLLLLPVVLVGDRVVSHPAVGTLFFDLILAAGGVYGLLMLADAWRPVGAVIPAGLLIGCDLALVSALAFASGAAFAELRGAFFALPLSAALLLAPRRTAVASAATAAAYLLVAFTHPTSQRQRFAITLSHALYMLWIGLAAVILAKLLSSRRRRIGDLARARGALVAQAVSAEERARKRVSDALHDNAIQNLLAARQDLADARRGDGGAVDRAEEGVRLAIDQLRSTVRELHPYLLDHLDLPSALETIAEAQADRGGYQVALEVDPEAVGIWDQLIASLARELLSNAAKHANAGRVTVRLIRAGRHLILEVADDGGGFTEAQRLSALRAGHIGLAATRERVEACGGTLQIDSRPRNGASIRCMLPAAAGQPFALAADLRAAGEREQALAELGLRERPLHATARSGV
jgi:two-component system NarL family sensor kinase